LDADNKKTISAEMDYGLFQLSSFGGVYLLFKQTYATI